MYVKHCSNRTQVIDSKGHTLFRKEDITKGKFAFTTEEYEIFDVCFLSHTSGEDSPGYARLNKFGVIL